MNPKSGPKDFFLWAGAMIALWGGVIAFLALTFDYINYAYPDVLAYQPNPYQGSMPYEMASLIVLGPLFLILMRVIRREIAADPSRNEIWVRRWALYLTLFAAGATIVVDLIVLITTFLSGEELSIRFLLKVVLVLLVASAGFMHFIADLWGYWKQNPAYVRYVNYATGLLVVLTIAAGFLIVGSPQQARQMRLDDQRINDLQNIQSQVIYYWQQKSALPAALSDLNDPLSYWQMPLDPATGQPYTYKRYSPLDFGLCATFAAVGDSAMGYARPVAPYGVKGTQDNWAHVAGEVCFDRSIDPQLYPPAKPSPVN
ncbi:MAG: DUF5671 domain-containing protein [Patescibacteria group bacterium]